MVFLSHTHCWTPCDGPVPSRAGCGSSVAVEAVPWPRASVHPQELIQLMSTLKQAHFLTLSSWLQAQLDNLWILHVLGLKTETWRSFSSVMFFVAIVALVAVSCILGSVCITSAQYFMHESGETNSPYGPVRSTYSQPGRKVDGHTE